MVYFSGSYQRIIVVAFSFILTFVYAGVIQAGQLPSPDKDYRHKSTVPDGIPWRRLMNKIDVLERRVDELERNSNPKEIKVDCSSGETISHALNSIANGTALVTITVSGTCAENVTISRSNVTLRGDGAAAIQNTNASPTILINKGAANVTIENLSVSGGSWALNCDDNSSATIKNLEVTSALNGISSMSGSHCMVVDTTISNSIVGIGVLNGGSMRFLGGMISGNTIGAVINPEATIHLSDNDMSTGFVAGTPEVKNNFIGVWAVGGTIEMFGNALIDGNNTGVLLTTGGRLSIGSEIVSIKIQDNQTGVKVENMGKIHVSTFNGHPEISNNANFGIECDTTHGDTFDLNNIGFINYSGNGTDISPGCP